MCSPLCTTDTRIDRQYQQSHVPKLASFQQIEHGRDVAGRRCAQAETIKIFRTVSFGVVDGFPARLFDMNEHVAAFVIFNTVYNLIFSYFFAAFLKNDHPIRQLFYMFIVLECILWPLSFSLNRQYILKQVVVFSSWLLSLRVLYRKESMMRVCLAFLIHSFSAAFIELILAMIFYLIGGNLFNYQNFMNVPVSFYLMEATAFLVIFTCCIRLASKAVFEKNRIFVCQFCLFGVQTLVFLFFMLFLFRYRCTYILCFYLSVFIGDHTDAQHFFLSADRGKPKRAAAEVITAVTKRI